MKLNLDLRQSFDKTLAIVARDFDGDRLDLTGLTGTAITWKLARVTTRDADNTAVLTYDLDDGITLTDADRGEFSIAIDGADLGSLFGEFTHECKLTVGGTTFRPVYGNATVARDIE